LYGPKWRRTLMMCLTWYKQRNHVHIKKSCCIYQISERIAFTCLWFSIVAYCEDYLTSATLLYNQCQGKMEFNHYRLHSSMSQLLINFFIIDWWKESHKEVSIYSSDK
jgi:hypothetical protein